MDGQRRDGERTPGEAHNTLPGTVGGSATQIGNVTGEVHIGVAPAAPAQRTIPHEVPQVSRNFTDREPERRLAYELLEPGRRDAVRMAVFTGLPGVGKTALAHWFATSTSGTYTGGELYVDFSRLRDVTGTAVSDGLAECLRSLGVHDRAMPATLGERAKLYRTRTAAEPVLVVLDDVHEPAEARPFVPTAPGSAVLITSNHRLSELHVDDAEPLPVEPLGEEESTTVLFALCDRLRAEDAPAVRALVRWSGGFAVALRVMAARLRTQPSLPVAELVDEIAHSDSGSDTLGIPGEVLPVLHAAYRALPPDAARLYRTLGVLPGESYAVELVAEVLECEKRDARRTLTLLAEACLVSDDGPGRYRAHRLVCQHAEGCARAHPDSDEQDREVRRRAVAHYLRRAAFADRAVLGRARLRIGDHAELLAGGADPFEERKVPALAWLDQERANLMAVLRTAVEEGWNRQAWQLAEAMTALYVTRRQLQDWVQSARLGVTAAQLDNAPRAVARLRSFVSRPLVDLGELATARRELDAALPLARESDDSRLEASVWELLGRYHDALAGLVEDAGQRAVSSYRRALRLFASVNDHRGQAFVLHFLGRALDGAGDPDGVNTLERAREMIREVPDQRMEGRTLTSMGIAYFRRGQREQAVETLRESVALLSASGDVFDEAAAQEQLAAVAEASGDDALRRSSLARAVAVHEEFGSPRATELRRALDALAE